LFVCRGTFVWNLVLVIFYFLFVVFSNTRRNVNVSIHYKFCDPRVFGRFVGVVVILCASAHYSSSTLLFHFSYHEEFFLNMAMGLKHSE
jgi:hypothetical protein